MTLTLHGLAARPRAMVALAAALLSVACVTLLQGAPARSAAAGPATAPTLAQIARTAPGHQVQVIVRFADRVRWDRGPRLLARYGGTVTRDLHIVNGYGVRMSAAAAERLAGAPGVAGVTLNARVRSSSEGGSDCDAEPVAWLTTGSCAVQTSFLQSTRTPKLWHDTGAAGGGQGVAVAVIDTGIAGGLPDFRTSASDPSSRVVASVVTNPDATTEDDTFGHGTHVAGLIAGNGSLRDAGDPLRGRYLGAAPRANLVSIKVSDDQGATSLIDVIYGLQFALDFKNQYGIRVVNLSLDATDPSSYRTDPLDAAVEAAWMHGLVVVAAAGNHGADAGAVDYAPGNDPYAITVGAVDDQGTKRTSDDALADWSGRGTTQDGVAKPDVVAPGTHIVSTYAPNSAFGDMCPSCIVDGQYFRVGGTSMSTAIVSGIVADLLSAHPSWTPDQVKGALVHAARTVAGGAAEVDAQAANRAHNNDLVSNTGLTPNDLVDPATGDIDYTRASWSRASWSQVDGARASWSRASWSRASWSRASWSCDCALAVTAPGVDPSRASWSRASWSRASWSRASWSSAFDK